MLGFIKGNFTKEKGLKGLAYFGKKDCGSKAC